ncbi:M16 family metallopeptidase [Tellurirhabdus bombi]|uniref:M16 family metallopeptidase n=1 Tax=Tellurirhabdus bombi TaxID=2907205 RepID=UPI001F17AADA|nr:pitrilysin family protein [Tellurirhabdus bombi]
MTLDRTLAPAFKTVDEIRVPSVETFILDNEQPVYLVRAGEQPILRLECIFEAGSCYEPLPGISTLSMKMLAEGTRQRSSAQINSYLDRYGAFLESHSGTDRSSLTIYCLNKYLPEVLPLLQELLAESVIPEKELADQINITRQNLQVNLGKNNYLASTLIRQNVFGASHPYGYRQTPETLDAIQQQMVEQFYQQRIQNRPYRIVLAGQVTEMEFTQLNRTLGSQALTPNDADVNLPPIVTTNERTILLEKEESLQSSIRLGRLLFTRQHPDYFPVLVLNEVLGGYFGSRLMKNIREEKGFTYGIWSSLSTFPRAGYWTIGTDVKREFTQQTLDETRKEIRRLQEELVPDEEMDVVKNYMAGSFVGSLNTPFEIADRYKGILLDGLPADYLTTYIDNLRAVSAEQVLEMANKYLQEKDLIEVVVGGK